MFSACQVVGFMGSAGKGPGRYKVVHVEMRRCNPVIIVLSLEW